MRIKNSFWIMISIAICAAAAIKSGNLVASVFIGTGTGILLMIITNLETDTKTRN